MAKLSEPVMAQISVMSSSGAKTLTKQARVSDIESCQPFLSTASTDIVCVRPTNRNQNQNKRNLKIRSYSANRILEEDIRVVIGKEDDFREKKIVGSGKNYSKKIIAQISDKSYLSWQDSETSCQDSLSTKQDSSSTRQGSPFTRQWSPYTRQESFSTSQDSLSIRQGSLSNRQDSFSTTQESVTSGPDSSASQGVSPMFGSTQNKGYATRDEPVRRYWGHRRSYTGFGGHSWADGYHNQSMESVERLSQNRCGLIRVRGIS